MKKKAILTLVACIISYAITVYVADAQMNPAGRGGFGGAMGRGFGRGQVTPPGPPAPVP
jgi:hypothetical protein